MITPNFDTMLERLRERQIEPRDDDYAGGYCASCDTQLTIADVDAGECSQCHSSLESDDEDLNDFNGWEAGL